MTFSNAEGHIPWHILAETLLHGNGKVYMAYNSNCHVKVKDFSKSQAVTLSVKAIICWKWFKTEHIVITDH